MRGRPCRLRPTTTESQLKARRGDGSRCRRVPSNAWLLHWFPRSAAEVALRLIVAKTETPRPRKERFGAHIEAYRGGMRASRPHIFRGSCNVHIPSFRKEPAAANASDGRACARHG